MHQVEVVIGLLYGGIVWEAVEELEVDASVSTNPVS